MDDPIVLHAAINEYVEIIRELKAKKHIGIYTWGVFIGALMSTCFWIGWTW